MKCALLYFLFVSCLALPLRAQDQAAPPAEQRPAPTAESIAKAEQIIGRAIEALGGQKYLNVRTVTGRGFYTPFQDGVSGVPSTFTDYLVYPNKERTEFRTAGVRAVQTNTGETGWIYDGAARTIKDMKPDQVEDFRFAMRVSTEFLLRGWWREAGAKLDYVGRREAGVGRRNETVSLTHADGLVVEYEFGARDNLPAKLRYARKRGDEEEVKEEDRFAQFINVSGVLVPFIIDHFRNGVQTSRLNYQGVEINQAVPDSLFVKPADVKAFK